MFRRLLRKEVLTHSLLAVGTGGFLVLYSSHAIFNDRIAKYYKVRDAEGTPVPLRAHMKMRINEVMADFGITEWNKSFYHLFVCEGLEPFELGSTTANRGVQIGIPQFMQAANEEEISQYKILIDNKPVDWDSPDGDRLLKSLQLSEQAQKFAIAKLLLHGDNYQYVFEAFLPSLMLSTFYGVANAAHSFFNLLHKPILSSVIVHSVIGGFIVLIYIFCKDGIRISYDKNIDEKVYEKGELYIKGGIEYYEKIVERNKALRNLLKNGDKRYNIDGNETNFFKAIGLPETLKLKMAIEYLEKDYQKVHATEIPIPRTPQPIM